MKANLNRVSYAIDLELHQLFFKKAKQGDDGEAIMPDYKARSEDAKSALVLYRLVADPVILRTT